MASSPEPTAAAPLFALLDERIREAVEGVAGTDPAPADPFRGLYISDGLAVALARSGAGEDLEGRLDEVVRALDLDALDGAVLGLCAAPELSPHYGRLYAYLHDDVTRRLATPRLVARLLAGEGVRPGDVLASFGRDGRLRRTGAIALLEPDRATPLAERPVKVADRLAACLLGSDLDAPAADGRLRRVGLPRLELGREAAAAELRRLLAAGGSLPVVAAGPDAAAVAALALGRPLLLIDLADAGDAALVAEAELAAALEGRGLCFEISEDLEPAERRRLARALASRDERALVCAPAPDAAIALGDVTSVVVDVPLPSFAERRSAWSLLAGGEQAAEVAAKFRLSSAQIAEAAEAARLLAAARGDSAPTREDLHHGARRASGGRLGQLASRIEPTVGWDDLVLPERQRQLLGSVSAYLRHRDLVLSDWGYERTVARSQGIKVLFAGESGTGKTLAAQVLARDIGLDLFRIDLATIVSKYIGETEKNLDRVFAAAEGSNAILFFDEADALFGKRSEVSDAHDRYANIEVAYLLQKMESYAGAVVLATNFRHNVDTAFLRRLDFVVDFPFPEADDRKRIWRLVLPSTAPVAEDVDVAFLAERFKLSGGSIRNASLAGAFLAADDGGVIGMPHLVRGVALEYAKLGRLMLESEFERFHALVRPVATATADGSLTR